MEPVTTTAATPDEYPLCGPCFVHDHLACKGCGCGYCADLRQEDDDQ